MINKYVYLINWDKDINEIIRYVLNVIILNVSQMYFI